ALVDELAGVVLDGVVEVLGHRVPRIGPEGPDGLEEDEQPQCEAEADGLPPARCVEAPRDYLLRHFSSSAPMEVRASGWFPGNLSVASDSNLEGGRPPCCRSWEWPEPMCKHRPTMQWSLACSRATGPHSRFGCADTISGSFGRPGPCSATRPRRRTSSRTPGYAPIRISGSSRGVRALPPGSRGSRFTRRSRAA